MAVFSHSFTRAHSSTNFQEGESSAIQSHLRFPAKLEQVSRLSHIDRGTSYTFFTQKKTFASFRLGYAISQSSRPLGMPKSGTKTLQKSSTAPQAIVHLIMFWQICGISMRESTLPGRTRSPGTTTLHRSGPPTLHFFPKKHVGDHISAARTSWEVKIC